MFFIDSEHVGMGENAPPPPKKKKTYFSIKWGREDQMEGIPIIVPSPEEHVLVPIFNYWMTFLSQI